MMANSGARGSFKQIRQLAGMRGLMAQSEGRDHRAPDPVELHGGPVGPRVLHLDARRPQGPRRHRAAHGRLGLPDAAARRRLAGRDRARGRLRRRAATSRCRRSRSTAGASSRCAPTASSRPAITSETFDPKHNEQIVGRVLAADIDPDAGLAAGQPISRHFGELIYQAKADRCARCWSRSSATSDGKKPRRTSIPSTIAEAIPGPRGAGRAVPPRDEAGEDPFLPLEAVEDLRTPEKFLRRMEDDGYAASSPLAGRSPEDVRRLELRTLVWALNELLERACTVAVRSVLTCEAPDRRLRGLLRPLAGHRRRARTSATRSASSPPSRSASRARS